MVSQRPATTKPQLATQTRQHQYMHGVNRRVKPLLELRHCLARWMIKRERYLLAPAAPCGFLDTALLILSLLPRITEPCSPRSAWFSSLWENSRGL